MSKYSVILLFCIVSLSLSLKNTKMLSKKKAIEPKSGDCNWYDICGSGLTCKDYRCITYEEEKSYKELEWGIDKCNIFHWCKKENTECVEHRCVYNPNNGQEGSICTIDSDCNDFLECVDYHCLTKQDNETHTPEKWTPEGNKCNIFHWCPKGQKCEEHSCVVDESDPETGLEGSVCSWHDWCGDGFVCQDYRCVKESEADKNHTTVYTPDSDICDAFHFCPTNSHCVNYRCEPTGGEGYACTYSWSCKDGFVCKDYRCITEEAAKTYKELSWGEKCNWLHSCEAGKECVDNRCVEKI